MPWAYKTFLTRPLSFVACCPYCPFFTASKICQAKNDYQIRPCFPIPQQLSIESTRVTRHKICFLLFFSHNQSVSLEHQYI